MRIYLPSTLARLSAGIDAGDFHPAVAYAVTPSLREWYTEGDLEELEYAAAAAAARASLQLLADELVSDDPVSGPPSVRRVVVAADVPDAAVRPAPDLGRAAVRVAEPVMWRHVRSALVDDESARDDVRRALAALDAAAAGDEDARFVIDSVEDHELAWYAAQEIDALVELES
jgi:hypothetical protein